MDVLNKFYTSVSSVLPGNPLTREFEIAQCVGSAGPGLLWKIYRGYKKSTKQEAAVFIFEKKQLDKFSKTEKENILDMLRKGIAQLTKLRHPHVLTVQNSLDESRDSLAFATEPVFASLSDILYNTQQGNKDVNHYSHLKDFKLHELEIKYGLIQICEGLAFLHNDVKLLHRNISPQSVIINSKGAWKIFGFDMCVANRSPAGKQPFWPFVEYAEWNNPVTQPNLDYLAPEYTLSARHCPASDIYSLGMLIYVMYSQDHQTLGEIGVTYQKYQRFAAEIRNVSPSKLLCIPENLREYVKLMLNPTPELRPDPHQFIKIPYFEDVGVKTLHYLDSLFQWDNLQKSQFYKGLPQVLYKMPHRICLQQVLPCLTLEFVNAAMVPFVLPSVLIIAENSSQEEYMRHIFPAIKPIMTIKDPIQILLIFMQKMDLLLKLTPGEEVKTDILPMLYRALESDSPQIQEMCLTEIPKIGNLIDYRAMKSAVIPRIKKVCLSTNSVSVRVNCLVCIGKVMDNLDKWLVLDDVIPFLVTLPSKEPAVLMGVLGIFKLAMSNEKIGLTKEVMATKILPYLIPLCIENGLTMNQFAALMSLVKQMLSIVESEHKAKLQQLNSIQNETKGLENTLKAESLVPAPPTSSEIEQLFAGLGVEAPMNNATDKKEGKVTVTTGQVEVLSIEEKQRIAMQQETARKVNPSTQPLNPAPAQTKPPPRPVDLTDKLLSSNLTQLSNKPTTQPFAGNQINNTMTSPVGTNVYNMGLSSPQGAVVGNMLSSPGFNTAASHNISWNPNVSYSTNYNQSSTVGTGFSTNYNASSTTNAGFSTNYNASSTTNAGFSTNYNASSTTNAGFSTNYNACSTTNAGFSTNYNASSTANAGFSKNYNQNNSAKQDWSAFESLLPSQNKSGTSNSDTSKKLNDTEMMDLLR